MNKKAMIVLYYIGLVTGIIIMNYIINFYIDYSNQLINSFMKIDKINFVDGRELFSYLFWKRLKQITIIFLSYFYISKKITFLVFLLYFSFIQGMVLSLFTFYYGLSYIFPVCLLLMPCYICIIFLEKAGLNCMDKWNHMKEINYINIVVFIVVVTIVLTIGEMFINFKVSLNIFTHK